MRTESHVSWAVPSIDSMPATAKRSCTNASNPPPRSEGTAAVRGADHHLAKRGSGGTPTPRTLHRGMVLATSRS